MYIYYHFVQRCYHYVGQYGTIVKGYYHNEYKNR